MARKQPQSKPKREGVDGARVRERRLALNLNQLQLAYLTGLHPGALSRIESNKKEVNARSLYRLVVALKTNADYLLGLSDDPTPE